MSSYPREALESQASQGRVKGMKLPHVGLIRSSPWDQMEGEVLGSRVWRRTWEGESSGRRAERAGTVNESLGVRERDLNIVGPKRLTSVRPVRPRLKGDVLVLWFAV